MYDGPEPFEGQNVCIIGTGPSSADIAYEVGMVAKSMTVVGRHHKGEAMVSTRGYEYYFPFLDGIETDVGEHLLELMMWPNDPTLIFIGLPSGVAKVYAQFMSGRLSRESLGEFSLINKDSVFKMNVICPELGLPSRAVYWRHLVDLLAGDDYQINLRHWRMCTEINNDVSPEGSTTVVE
ncbi:monooxygenase [Perkinsus olseni]|uniref:Monooxygenase n=1 Tax=Perkinsus olseni TaxID=32597 RepID=A0A7J6L5H2_PEROL|nr:monooxygenase [Perkinsus olseni]